MEYARIVLTCIAVAVVYGIIHDEFTAHICVEYFTIAHPRIIESTSPTVLGIVWGICATWWIALLMGLILSFVARHGNAPKVGTQFIFFRILGLFLVAALCAIFSGTVAYFLASNHLITLSDPAILPEKHAAFLSVWAAHLASYCVSIICGMLLILNIWHIRAKQQLAIGEAHGTK